MIYLIHPESIYPPMGTLYLADSLRWAGMECELYDLRSKFYNKLDSDHRKGEKIIVCMSVMTSPEIKEFYILSDVIKKTYPGSVIIWGGPHPTLNAEQCIKEDYIDYVVTGYAEKTLPIIIRKIMSDDQESRIIAGDMFDIDDYRPAWECILPLSQYLFPAEHSQRPPVEKKNIFYYLHTSRGCMYNCSFCSVSKMRMGKRWTPHSFEWVQGQIDYIKNQIEDEGKTLDGIGFWDDMFFGNMARAKKILDYLQGLDIGYLVEARADMLLANKGRLFKYLADTGCMQVFIGAESFNKDTLKRINKNIDPYMYYELKVLADKYKLPTRFSLIVGFPEESGKSIKETLNFAKYIKDHSEYCSISGPKLFTPYPGTLEYDRAIEAGFVPPATTLEWASINRHTENYLDKFPWINKLPDDIKQRIYEEV